MNQNVQMENSKRIIIKRKHSFIGREKELKEAIKYFTKNNISKGNVLNIQGDSGIGKTYFAKELICNILEIYNYNLIPIYFDVSQDLFESSKVISCLLSQLITPSTATFEYPTNIAEDQTLIACKRVQKKKRIVGKGITSITPHLIGMLGGVGATIEKALVKTLPQAHETSEEDELLSYLKWASSKWIVLIVIDNYQFLDSVAKASFLSVFQTIESQVNLIFINRTIDNKSTLAIPLECYFPKSKGIQLKPFSLEQTESLIIDALGKNNMVSVNHNHLKKLTKDIYVKSLGLPKDIRYCLDKYLLEIKRGVKPGEIEGLLSTLDKLPEIHRQFLLIVSLLNGGLKKKIIQQAIHRMNNIINQNEIASVCKDLIAWEYLKINSESMDRVKPGHERIIQAMRGIVDDDFHEQVRSCLITELIEAIQSGDVQENETYLLHCLVGLHNTKELLHNIHYVSRLSRNQYCMEQFTYLTALGNEFETDILQVLPEDIISKFLDSYQKTSQFDSGLNFISKLESDRLSNRNLSRLYRFKFLIQLYQYEEALSISGQLGNDIWKLIYELNAYLALCKDQQALSITNTLLNRPEDSEAYAVFLRNIVTLFPAKKSLLYLKKSKQIFKKTGSDFRIATVYNNTGLVYLWANNENKAEICFEKSIKLFHLINSQEIFQPLANLGITFTCRKLYSRALKCFDIVRNHIPNALLLDQVKLEMNSTVVKILQKSISYDDANNIFTDLLHRIKGVQMPYIRSAIEFNMSQIKFLNDEILLPPTPNSILKPSEKVSLHKYIFDENQNKNVKWILTMSIHWRY